MLFFLTFLLTPIFPQDCAILNASYVQEYESEEDVENKTDDDGLILLSYNSDSPSGSFRNVSKDCSNDEEENSEDCDKPIEKPAKTQETSCNQSMEKEFADMRIIQLANTIASDLGIITKVSLSR